MGSVLSMAIYGKIDNSLGHFRLSHIINNPITISNCFPLTWQNNCSLWKKFAYISIGHSWVRFCATKRYWFYFILRLKSFSFNWVLLNIFHIWNFFGTKKEIWDRNKSWTSSFFHSFFCFVLQRFLSQFFLSHIYAWPRGFFFL